MVSLSVFHQVCFLQNYFNEMKARYLLCSTKGAGGVLFVCLLVLRRETRVQSVTCFPHKGEDWSSCPQHSCKCWVWYMATPAHGDSI